MKLFFLALFYFTIAKALPLSTALRLHTDSQTSLLARLSSIQKVNEHLDIEAFYLENDRIGRSLLKEILLKKAKKPLLQIRLLFDAWGSQTIDENLACQLKNSGINIKFFNKKFKIFNQQRTHRKIWIADNIAIVGGRNLSEENFSMEKNDSITVLSDWDLEVSGQIVKNIQKSFEQAWNQELTQIPDCSNNPNIKNQWIQQILNTEGFEFSLKTEKNPEWKKAEVEWFADPVGTFNERPVSEEVAFLIRTAKRTVEIENAYFLPIGIIAEELGNAQKKGLHIAFYINGPSMKYWMARYSTCLPLNELQWWMNMGAQITFTPIERRTHAKSLYTDEEVLAIGSFNFDSRSINSNAETLLVIRNSPQLFNEYNIEHHRRINEGFTVKKISQVFEKYNFSEKDSKQCLDLSNLKPLLKNFF